MENVKRNIILLRILYFIRFFADAMFYSYTSLYLSSIGLMEGLIGTITSINTITTMLINPICSIFAKNTKRIRIMLIIAAMIEGSLIIVYGNLTVIPAIMILTALMAVASGPFYNMLDGYTQSYNDQTNTDYSKIRIMGSIAYLSAIILCSFIVERIGYTTTFIIAGSIFILCGLSMFFLPKYEKKEQTKERNYKSILTNKRFIFYTICYLLFATTATVGDSFNSLFFTKELGLSVTEYSYVQIGILVAETVTMFVAARFLKKANYLYIVSIGALLYGVKFILMGFTSLPVGFIIAAACLRGVAWGLVLYAHVKTISKLVGVENITTALMLFAFATGAFTFILNNSVGYLIEAIGYTWMYIGLGSIVCITAIIYFLGFLFTKTNKLLSNRSIESIEIQNTNE